MGSFIAICTMLVVTGCFTPPPSPPPRVSTPPSAQVELEVTHEGEFDNAHVVPYKDFVSLGMVFAQYELQRTQSGNEVSYEGNVFTYHELLREAQRLGADAIINVTIDMITRSERIGIRTVRNQIWYGSALAIRYTNAVIIPLQ